MKKCELFKWLLIVQSFLPLFFLVIVRCYEEKRIDLIFDFISELFCGNFDVINTALKHTDIFAVILLCFSVIMFIFGLVVYVFFIQKQTAGFKEKKYTITVDEDVSSNSVTFFVTYITPLVLSDIDESRGFVSFIAIVVLLILLMRNTNLYYQNPFLSILGYKSFYFKLNGKKCVAITRGYFDESKLIKLKHISDNVYLVYNKEKQDR